jgi:hypothetical protein
MSPRRRDCLPASSSHPPVAQHRGRRGEPRAAASSVRGRRHGELRATRPTVTPPGERPEVGAELTPRSPSACGEERARRHRDIPTRVRRRGGAAGSSALAVGELRVEAAACTPGALAARSLDAEGAGPQRAVPATSFPPRRSSSGGAPPRGQISLQRILGAWPAI